MRLAYFIPAMSSHFTLGEEWSQETVTVIVTVTVGISKRVKKNTLSEKGYVQDRFSNRFLVGIIRTTGKKKHSKNNT